MHFKNLLLTFSLILLVACGDSGSDDIPQPAPVQGSRVLGLDVKETPSVPYGTAYQQAMNIGVREVSVSLDWSLLEPTASNYDNDLLDIIDAFYPLQLADTTLVLRPLDTPGPNLPSDLASLDYNHTTLIAAFESFLENLHTRLPNLNASGKLTRIQIGNEIDAYLGSDATKWSQWQTFFNAAKAKINSLWGSSVKVSSVVQFSALKNAGVRTQYLNALPGMDSATFTYYPLNADFTVRSPDTVATDFDFIINTITNKPVVLQECGYPSSNINNSSEALQADFVTAVFEAWDKHRERITLIDFTWQYDVSQNTIDQWVIDYGMSGNANENAFRGYLATLGFSNFDSTEKPALQRLKDELKKRSWQP